MIYVKEKNFADAHYRLVERVLSVGVEISTDYDKEGGIKSLDSPAIVEITNPLSPPIFSKCVYDSAESLVAYGKEIVEGTHDHLVDKLSYTYHDRYKGQLDGVINEVKRSPFTRRAQFITWVPDKDLGAQYPPCFQRGVIRVVKGVLNFHSHWRSRDLIKAWGSNVYGFACLHKMLAIETGYPVGIYREFIDSLHIYGEDISIAEAMIERPMEAWYWEDVWKQD